MSKSVSRRSVLAGLTGLAAGGLSAPNVARAAVRIVRIGYNNADDSHYGRGAAAFARAVASDPSLAGMVSIQPHGKAELGDDLSMLKGCASGALDMVVCSNSVMSNVVPEFGVLDAPFLFKDVAHARATVDGPIDVEFAGLARAKNLHLVAWTENGMRQITANRPVRTPADLRGLKIRVPQSKVMMDGFKALGANPAPLSFGLLREALRTGQFDAQENPIINIELSKLYELQKYVSLTNHIYGPAVFLASADVMEDLTEPQRAALAACAKKGAAVTRQVVGAAQEEGIGRLRAAGMTVVDDVDIAAFQGMSRPYLDGLAATYGADRMRRLIGAGA